MRRLPLAVLACLPLLVLPTTSSAETSVLLGPPLLSGSAPFATCDALSPHFCTAKTFVPTSLPEPGAMLATPADGTIVSWRVKGAPPAKLKLRIVRSVGGGQFKGINTSGVAKVSDGVSDNVAAIGIAAGDQVGIELANEPLYSVPSSLLGTTAPGAAWSEYATNLADEATASPTSTGTGSEPLFNATVVLAKPLLFGASATSGPQTGGDIVVITGAHLAIVRGVTFGGTPAQILKAGPNQVLVNTPAHAPGSAPIVLSTAGGPSDPIPYGYTPVAPPAPDTAGPRLTQLNLAPVSFRAPKRPRISWRSDEPGRVSFTLLRKRRHRGFARLEDSFSAVLAAGPNRLRLPRGVARGLRPGRYRLLATATDELGNSAKPLRRAFRVLLPKRERRRR